jgi:hypothetical protein
VSVTISASDRSEQPAYLALISIGDSDVNDKTAAYSAGVICRMVLKGVRDTRKTQIIPYDRV